jgi:PAS domain S-box-containing protein
MHSTILYIGNGDNDLQARLEQSADEHATHLVRCQVPDVAVHKLRQMQRSGDCVKAIVLGPQLKDAFSVARELGSAAPEIPIIFLCSPKAAETFTAGPAGKLSSQLKGTIAELASGDIDRVFNDALRNSHPARPDPKENVAHSTEPESTSTSSDYRRLVISDRYLASILTHAQDAIVSTDNFGTILTWNSAAERTFGYNAHAAIGKNLNSMFSDSGSRDISDILGLLREGQPEVRRELTMFRLDGSALEIEATLAPVRDDFGRQIGISIIARDITERKRAEEALRSSEKLAATGRLAATIAHEINNPLESITNLLYLLQNHSNLDNTARDYANMAQKELGRVAHIARQMLGFYREAPRPIPLRLRQVVDNVVELYQRKAKLNQSEICVRCEFEGEIQAYPAEMRQVFSNLVVNALEASGTNGSVLVHIYASPDWRDLRREGVRVVVADNGPGIGPENLRRIFEPFFTTKGERGTGLGLWVTRGIVQKHGGHIHVRSRQAKPKNGTIFSVFLPLLYSDNETTPEGDTMIHFEAARSA